MSLKAVHQLIFSNLHLSIRNEIGKSENEKKETLIHPSIQKRMLHLSQQGHFPIYKRNAFYVQQQQQR